MNMQISLHDVELTNCLVYFKSQQELEFQVLYFTCFYILQPLHNEHLLSDWLVVVSGEWRQKFQYNTRNDHDQVL